MNTPAADTGGWPAVFTVTPVMPRFPAASFEAVQLRNFCDVRTRQHPVAVLVLRYPLHTLKNKPVSAFAMPAGLF
jgi:hypothetical protein